MTAAPALAAVDTATGEVTQLPTPSTVALPNASTSIGQIAGALAKAQGSMRHAIKDSDNSHFKSKYADLASVMTACREHLAENGIAVVQRPLATTDPGVLLQTILLHDSGEWLADDGMYLPASKLDAHGYGSAMTYARRYGLASLVGVAQDDDDGNAAATATTGQARQSAPRAAAPAKLAKAQTDQLVAKLVEGGMTKATATASAKTITPEQFDRAMAKAQKLIDEQAGTAAEAGQVEPCNTCEGAGTIDGDTPCSVCQGTGEVAT